MLNAAVLVRTSVILGRAERGPRIQGPPTRRLPLGPGLIRLRAMRSSECPRMTGKRFHTALLAKPEGETLS